MKNRSFLVLLIAGIVSFLTLYTVDKGSVSAVSGVPILSSTGATQLFVIGGSGAGTANGDFISDASGVNSFYSFFVEAPPNLGRLNVEIFDADVGAGGTSEATAGRDRARGSFNSSVTYSIRNPRGQARTTQFTTGNTTLPVGADNAWLSLYDVTGDNVRDEFSSASYANDNGQVNWSGNWIEGGDNDNPGTGLIQITGGELRIRDNGNSAPLSSIERQVDLSGPGFPGAVTLSFDRRSSTVGSGDQMRIDISSNGGSTWTTVQTFTGTIASGTSSFDITAFKAANTRIRFIHVTGYSGTESFFVDNVNIQSNTVEAGHWEVRVDMSSSVTTGDDLNAFGIRAHDGTPGPGGIELPIYAESFYSIGANPPASGTNSRAYDVYPYITSGCSCAYNDFDYDSNAGNVGNVQLTSRTGGYSQSIPSTSLSANNVWARIGISNWTSDSRAGDYGIWHSANTVTSYVVSGTPNGNYANFYFNNFAAASNPPATNPTANTFRIYLPSDSGAAPIKPYLEQDFVYFAGPNPALAGQTSSVRMIVRLVNPTAHPITFSAPANVITTHVPGAGVVYAGNAMVSQGTLVSQPSIGGTGNIVWDPGSVPAGSTQFLIYDLNLTPSSSGQRLPLNATPASGNGTRAQFIDETGNSTQQRATYLFGPLCELAITENVLIPRYNCGAVSDITPALLPDGIVSVGYNAPLTPANTVLLSGSVPAGMSIVDGVLTGTPTEYGTFTFVLGTPMTPGLSPNGCGTSRSYTLQIYSPTSASVSITGRVVDPTGRAIPRTLIELTGENGERRTAMSNHFGYFRFADVSAGSSYLISATAKHHIFESRLITVDDEIGDLLLIGERLNQ